MRLKNSPKGWYIDRGQVSPQVRETQSMIIVHNPLGVGLGRLDLFDAAVWNKSYLQEEYFVYPTLRERMGFENTFLDVLYSLGLFGLFAFLFVIDRFYSAFQKTSYPGTEKHSYSAVLIRQQSIQNL
jgi:hypothetical protein